MKQGWRFGLGILILIGWLGGGGLGCRRASAPFLTLEEAFEDLLRVMPAFRDGVRSEMISSTDPSGGNADWADWNLLHAGGDRYRLAFFQGPGCLRRIWMTNVRAEEWLFFLDGEAEPRLRLTEAQLFGQETSATVFPFEPPLADTLSGGAFSYVPIPFQRSLEIMVRISHVPPDARPYFHFNVEFYPKRSRVESFPRRFSDLQRKSLARVLNALRDRDREWSAISSRLSFQSVALRPGEEIAIWDQDGPGTIDTLAIRPLVQADQSAISQSRLLRELVLRAWWEENPASSIETPLGDFFCNGLHLRRFVSAAFANDDHVLICRFPMSWRRHARLTLRNDGRETRRVEAAVEMTPKIEEPVRYFHSSWADARSGGRPFRIMRTEGKGLFVGCYLIAHGNDGGWNILEGDERFYRDGELSPVHTGTGLEDYFNGGWYYYGLMERPFHGLLEKGAMRTAQYRLQIPDPVTFEKSLQMVIEFGDGNRAQGYMSAAAWWYQDQPGPAGSRIPPLAQRFPPFDTVAFATAMCELFELERAGLDREAEARSAWLSNMLEGTVWGTIFQLRTLAYREIREGPEMVRPLYEAFAAKETLEPEVREQAALLAWRATDPHRALYGGNGHAEIRLFIDGREIGTGSLPHEFRPYPVELEPGEHFLRMEIRPRGEFSWYTAAFFSTWTNVVSDQTWDFSWQKPEGWPASSGDPTLWRPYAQVPWFFPSMQWWRFAPNAFPLMQSGRQVGGPEPGWEHRVNQVLYLQRRLVVPEEPVPWNPFVRRREIRTPPLRPPDDTSNSQVQRQ